MIELILEGIAAFFVLWIIFINFMWAERNLHRIPKWLHIPIKIFGAIGYLYDVFFNFTWGILMFMQLPEFHRPTLSQRMKKILITEKQTSWRFKLAFFVCRKLVEPWDPNHCGLDDLLLEK